MKKRRIKNEVSKTTKKLFQNIKISKKKLVRLDLKFANLAVSFPRLRSAGDREDPDDEDEEDEELEDEEELLKQN